MTIWEVKVKVEGSSRRSFFPEADFDFVKLHLKQQGNHVGEAPTSGELKSRAAGQVEHVAVAPPVEQGGHGGSLGEKIFLRWNFSITLTLTQLTVVYITVSKCQM